MDSELELQGSCYELRNKCGQNSGLAEELRETGDIESPWLGNYASDEAKEIARIENENYGGIRRVLL